MPVVYKNRVAQRSGYTVGDLNTVPRHTAAKPVNKIVARLSVDNAADLRAIGAKSRRAAEIKVSGKRIAPQILADLTAVREHFGVNTSEALRISLHLAANAIRANVARVALKGRV